MVSTLKCSLIVEYKKYLHVYSFWGCNSNSIVGWEAVKNVGLAHSHDTEENNDLGKKNEIYILVFMN